MFRDDKATAASCFFLERAMGNRLNDLILMKLLYLAEKESLRQYSASITDSAFYSLKNGPILSEVGDLYHRPEASDLWNKHIRFLSYPADNVPENTVELKRPLDAGRYLSVAEIDILRRIWLQYRHYKKWSLVELTHTFPEWHKEARKTGGRYELPITRIFEIGLKDPPEVAKAKADDILYYKELLS